MKSINRTHRMEEGRKLPDGKTLLYEEVPGGMRKIRCPRCQHSIAVPLQTPDGKTTYRCKCGCTFQSTKL